MSREQYHGNNPEERKRNFVNRLSGLLKDKGWSQSELARRAGVSRDRISVYMRLNNNTIPVSANLQKVSVALGVNPVELVPEAISAENFGQIEPFSMKEVTGEPDNVFLQINKVVPRKKALKIATLLED